MLKRKIRLPAHVVEIELKEERVEGQREGLSLRIVHRERAPSVDAEGFRAIIVHSVSQTGPRSARQFVARTCPFASRCRGAAVFDGGTRQPLTN